MKKKHAILLLLETQEKTNSLLKQILERLPSQEEYSYEEEVSDEIVPWPVIDAALLNLEETYVEEPVATTFTIGLANLEFDGK